MKRLLKLETIIEPFVGERRYFSLLFSLIALTAIGPLIEHTILAKMVVGGMVALVLLFGSLSVSSSAIMKIVSYILAAVSSIAWLLAFGLNVHFLSSNACQIGTYLLILAFLITICIGIRKDIYSGDVTANRVAGSVCVFILIGFCFAMIHMMIALSDPLAYKSSTDQDPIIARTSNELRFPMYVYFSFCTLTTLGYGDIIPSNRQSRTVSWLEALSGQLFLTVMIARLVGMHVATTTPMQSRDEY